MSEGKPIQWVGSSKDDLSALPEQVRWRTGYALRALQEGLMPEKYTPLPEFGGGVIEIKVDADKETYRTVTIYNLKDAIYVLHAFHKKSKSGRSIPREEKELIRARAAVARLLSEKVLSDRSDEGREAPTRNPAKSVKK